MTKAQIKNKAIKTKKDLGLYWRVAAVVVIFIGVYYVTGLPQPGEVLQGRELLGVALLGLLVTVLTDWFKNE